MPTDIEPLKDTRLLFGLRTSQQITLTVLGQPKRQAPDLWILSNEQSTYAVLAHDRKCGHWKAVLPAGDHIVRMDAPGDSWFDGEIRFVLSAESTIVACKPGPKSQPASWTATTGVVDDPKYPSPPLAASQPLSDADWLCTTLQSLYGQLVSRRGIPDLHASRSQIGPSRDGGA